MTEEHKQKLREGIARRTEELRKKKQEEKDLEQWALEQKNKEVPSETPESDLDEKVNFLAQRVDSMMDLMKKVVENSVKQEEIIKKHEEGKLKTQEIPQQGSLIPRVWRAKVNEILGTDFGLEIQDSSGGDFVLRFILPEKWDRRTGDEKVGRDISVGLIHRSSDVSDVETWCKLIKENILKKHKDFKPVLE